jgi:hypothetical protein
MPQATAGESRPTEETPPHGMPQRGASAAALSTIESASPMKEPARIRWQRGGALPPTDALSSRDAGASRVSQLLFPTPPEQVPTRGRRRRQRIRHSIPPRPRPVDEPVKKRLPSARSASALACASALGAGAAGAAPAAAADAGAASVDAMGKVRRGRIAGVRTGENRFRAKKLSTG